MSQQLDFIEKRMLDTLQSAPQNTQDELAALAAHASIADLTSELQQRYPNYANYITEPRVKKVMAAYLNQDDEEEDDQDDQPAHDTGPLAIPMQKPRFSLNPLKWFNPLNWSPKDEQAADSAAPAPAMTIVREPAPAGAPENDFTRQRRAIEQFSEDYMPVGKRVLHSAARIVGYVLPALAVLAVGSDLGAFYAPGLGKFSSYLLSYAIECAIASLTIMLGNAAASPERNTSHKVKLAVTALVWILCQAGSALSLYVMAISVMSISITGTLFYVTIGWRVASTATLDLASIAILFWSGKSLQRYLNEMRQKTHAIVSLSDAEIDIKRAMQRADLRAKEDEMEMRARELRAAHLLRLDEVRNQAELARMGIVESLPSRSYDNGRAYTSLPSGVPMGQAQLLNETGAALPRPAAPIKKNLSVDLDTVLPALKREHPDWSRTRLAKSINVSPRTIARWEEKQRS